MARTPARPGTRPRSPTTLRTRPPPRGTLRTKRLSGPPAPAGRPTAVRSTPSSRRTRRSSPQDHRGRSPPGSARRSGTRRRRPPPRRWPRPVRWESRTARPPSRPPSTDRRAPPARRRPAPRPRAPSRSGPARPPVTSRAANTPSDHIVASTRHRPSACLSKTSMLNVAPYAPTRPEDTTTAPAVVAPTKRLSFTHISLLTEVLTVINLAAIFHNTVHLFELSIEP